MNGTRAGHGWNGERRTGQKMVRRPWKQFRRHSHTKTSMSSQYAALEIMGPHCSQKAGSKPDPWHVKECIDNLGLSGGMAPSTPGTKELENFQRLAGNMLHHSLDDPTIQFEMAMSGMCKRVTALADLSWRFKLDKSQQKLARLVDAVHAVERRRANSCRVLTYTQVHCLMETLVSSPSNGCFVIGRFRVLRIGLGMRCWDVGDGPLEKDAVGASNVDGQTRDQLGLIVCYRNDEVIWSWANQRHGYATLVVARELGKGLARAECDRHNHEYGGHGHAVLERHSQEDVGIDAIVLCRDAWGVYDGGRFGRGGTRSPGRQTFVIRGATLVLRHRCEKHLRERCPQSTHRPRMSRSHGCVP